MAHCLVMGWSVPGGVRSVFFSNVKDFVIFHLTVHGLLCSMWYLIEYDRRSGDLSVESLSYRINNGNYLRWVLYKCREDQCSCFHVISPAPSSPFSCRVSDAAFHLPEECPNLPPHPHTAPLRSPPSHGHFLVAVLILTAPRSNPNSNVTRDLGYLRTLPSLFAGLLSLLPPETSGSHQLSFPDKGKRQVWIFSSGTLSHLARLQW